MKTKETKINWEETTDIAFWTVIVLVVFGWVVATIEIITR